VHAVPGELRAVAVSGTRTLPNLATILRSKNAGPYRITFDALFPPGVYKRVRDSGAITAQVIAEAFGIPESDVLVFTFFDAARAMKTTLHRPLSARAVGETDVYGAQQHAPLFEIAVPWDDEAVGEARTWAGRLNRRSIPDRPSGTSIPCTLSPLDADTMRESGAGPSDR
jgi:hypothetical protein